MANPKIVFTGVDQASVVAEKIGGSINKLKLALGSIASAAVVGVFRNVVNDLDALEESAQSAGVAVETLSALRYAANQAGVGAEALDEALKKLNLKLVEAAKGGKEAQQFFKSLGINAVNSSGQILGADEALGRIADKFASFRDGPAKAALAVELFGKAGTKLIPLLNQGASGLEALKEEAQKLGVVLGAGVVNEAAKFNDQLDRLQASARSAGIQLFAPIIEGLNRMVGEFQAAEKAAGSFGGALLLLARQSQQTLDDPGQKINELTKSLEDIDRKLALPGARDQYVRGKLNDRALALKEELAFLKGIQVQRALLNRDDRGDPNLNRFRPLGTDPLSGSREQQISEGQRLIANLQQELSRTQELSEVQELQLAIAEKRVKFDSQAQQQRALAIAQSIDDERAFLAAVKASEEAVKSENVERQRQATSRKERLADLTGQSAIRRQTADVKLLDDAFFNLEITVQQYQLGLEKAFGVNSDVSKGLDKQAELAEQLGLTISSSLGDLITTGGTAREMFAALGQDILKLIIQLTVLKPLAEEIAKIFKSGGGGDSKSSWISLIAQFFGSMGGQNLVGVFDKGTDYVPRTGLALVHQGEAIIPAGKNSGGVTIVQHIDARGADVGTVRRAMTHAKREAQTEILESIRRRGVFARAG